MAIDKERFFSFFQDNYLPREDVLFKLPFSISIESFWAELLNRRKSKAIILPLKNGDGIPYWYTLTEKMVKSSEILCEQALVHTGDVNLQKPSLTAAMIEEMFFTSFVEGAQIQFDEALDFLQSGVEPENVNEQMMWNNRRAWTAMMQYLSRPLDEGFIKGLAYLLTNDMEGQADGYRRIDTHPIPGIENTSYSVPSASCLPERMQEFYAFLRSPSVHPLLKSAVAQAYLLVTRPFPDGNERLSRMVSSAVLLRSGYGFFLDISISSVIAKDGYRYYKAMKDIVTSENGGDFTYFLEYYLELLVKAVNDMVAQEKRIALEAEAKQLAAQQHTLDSERNMATKPLIVEKTEALGEAISSPPSVQSANEDAPFLERVQAFIDDSSKPEDAARNVRFLVGLYQRGLSTFALSDLRKESKKSGQTAAQLCNHWIEHGLISKYEENGRTVYYLISSPSASGAHIHKRVDDATKDEKKSELITYLAELGGADSPARSQRISSFLLEHIQNNNLSFCFADWEQAYPLGKNIVRTDILHAKNLGLIKSSERSKHNSYSYEYLICDTWSKRDINLINTAELSQQQRRHIAKIYLHYGKQKFTARDFSEFCGISISTLTYHLKNLTDRNILLFEKTGISIHYQIAVTPESYPECFTELEKQQKEIVSLSAASTSAMGDAAKPAYATSARAV